MNNEQRTTEHVHGTHNNEQQQTTNHKQRATHKQQTINN